jgi:hypothetical protein
MQTQPTNPFSMLGQLLQKLFSGEKEVCPLAPIDTGAFLSQPLIETKLSTHETF